MKFYFGILCCSPAKYDQVGKQPSAMKKICASKRTHCLLLSSLGYVLGFLAQEPENHVYINQLNSNFTTNNDRDNTSNLAKAEDLNFLFLDI